MADGLGAEDRRLFLELRSREAVPGTPEPAAEPRAWKAPRLGAFHTDTVMLGRASRAAAQGESVLARALSEQSDLPKGTLEQRYGCN